MKRSRENTDRLLLVRAATCALWLATGLPGIVLHCAFGEVADYSEEAAARIAFISSQFPADRGLGRVPVRFGDGGTDGFDTFNTGNAIVLSGANWVELDRIEINTGTATAYRAPWQKALGGMADGLGHLAAALSPVTELAAHGGDGGSSASGGETVLVAEDLFLQPLAGGSTGNGSDSLARPFYEATAPSTSFGSGTIDSVTLHIRRFQFSGTVDGTAFAVLHDSASDFTVSLSCYRTITKGETLSIPLYFNMAVLFRFLPSADAAGIASAFASNLSSSDLIQEHECF